MKEKIELQIVRQAKKIVLMRRKQALWKELEPQLGKLGNLVKKLEDLESESKVPRARKAAAGS